MKVLLLDVNYKHSSTGKIVADLHSLLRKNNHTSVACFGRGVMSREDDVFKVASSVEVISHVVLSRFTGWTGCYSPFATKRLIEIVEDYAPDVVHLHELHGYYINIARFIEYLKAKKIKVVWTFHCEFMYTGKCGYANDCDKWKKECGECPQLGEYPKSFFLDFTTRMHQEKRKLFEDFQNLAIVTPSFWLAERVQQSFLQEHRVSVVYNGIDTTEIFYPRDSTHLRQLHQLNDEKVILAVAPNLLSERKGGKWILELARLLRTFPAKIIMIGVEDHQRQLDPNVIALPLIRDQKLLAEYYSLAAVTVLPSKKETFSLVTAESLACGTPVVGFSSGAPSEVAPAGYGIFVDYGDITSLKDSILSVLNGETPMSSPSECARFAAHRYSKETMFQKYYELYAS